ncbi:MAG: hypothetical protein ACTJGH_06235 [Peptoniphilaceae bacterium]
MSKFLGFIHFLMFDKIVFQEKLVNQVLDLSEKKGYEHIKSEVDKLGRIEEGSLEDIIDQSNIHAWLNERVNLVENRFAKATSLLLEEDKNLEDELLNKFFKLGVEENFNGTAKEAYALINSKFLDGMPCDGSLLLLENEDDNVKYKIVKDLHTPIWEKFMKNPIYWDLRESYIKGLLSNAKFEISKDSSNIYEIRR